MVAVILILLPKIVMAESLVFSGYAETGTRATDEGDFEQELNDDYSYHNASIALSIDSGRAHYRMSGFQYEKKYDNLNYLNNESRVFNAGFFIGWARI